MRAAMSMIVALCVTGCDGGGGGGESLACEDGEPCGGDIVGAWEVVETCLEDDEIPIDDEECPEMTLRVEDVTLEGTFEFDDDGTYHVGGETSATIVISRPEECLNGASCDELEDAANDDAEAEDRPELSCVDADDGCDCSTAIEEELDEDGHWETEDSTLTNVPDDEDDNDNDYCVRGDDLWIRPVPEDQDAPEFSLVLRRQ